MILFKPSFKPIGANHYFTLSFRESSSEGYTAWKVSLFGVFWVLIFPNLAQKNSKYGHFSRSVKMLQ